MVSKSKKHASRGSRNLQQPETNSKNRDLRRHKKEKRRKGKKEAKDAKDTKKSFTQSILNRIQRKTRPEPELDTSNDSIDSVNSGDLMASAAQLDKMMAIPPNSKLGVPDTTSKLPSQMQRVPETKAIQHVAILANTKASPSPRPVVARKSPKVSKANRKASKPKQKGALPLQQMKKANEKGKKKKQQKEKPRERRQKTVEADSQLVYRKYHKQQADPESAYKKYQKKAEVAIKKKKKTAPKQPERRDFRSFSDSSDYSESDFESRYHSDDDYSDYSDSRYDSYSESESESDYSSHSSDSSGSYSTDETDAVTLVTKRAAWERNPEEDNNREQSRPKPRRKKHGANHISSPRKRKDNSNHISSPRRISGVRSSRPRNSSDRIRSPHKSKNPHERHYRDGDEDYSDDSSYFSGSSFYSSDSNACNSSGSSYSDSESYDDTYFDDDTRALGDTVYSASWTEGPRTIATYGSGETEPTRPTLLKDISMEVDPSMTAADSKDNISTDGNEYEEFARDQQAAKELEKERQAAKSAILDPKNAGVFSWILGAATKTEPVKANDDSLCDPPIQEQDEEDGEDETVYSSPRASRSQGLIHSPRSSHSLGSPHSEASSRHDRVIRNRRSINYSQDGAEEEPGHIYPAKSPVCSASVDQIIVADSMPESYGDHFLAPIYDHSETSDDNESSEEDLSTFDGDVTAATFHEKQSHQLIVPANHSAQDNQDSTVDDSCYRGEKMELASYHSDAVSSTHDEDSKRVKAEILDDYDVSEIVHGRRPFKSQAGKAKESIPVSNSLAASERRERRIMTMKAHRDFIYQSRSIDSNPSIGKEMDKSIDGEQSLNDGNAAGVSDAKPTTRSVNCDAISAGPSVISNSIAQEEGSAPIGGTPDALIDIVRNAFPFIMLSSGNAAAAAALETSPEEEEQEVEGESDDEYSNDSEEEVPTSPGAIEDAFEAALRFFAPKEETTPLITEEKSNEDDDLRCTNFNPNPTKVTAVKDNVTPKKIMEDEETNSVIAESTNVSSVMDVASSIDDSNLSDVAVNISRSKKTATTNTNLDESRFNADGIPLQLRPKKIWRAFDSGFTVSQSVVSTGASVETGNDSSGSSTEPKSNMHKDEEIQRDANNTTDNNAEANDGDNDELVLRELVLSEIDEDLPQPLSEIDEDLDVSERNPAKDEVQVTVDETEQQNQQYLIEEIDEDEEVEEPEPHRLHIEAREAPKLHIDSNVVSNCHLSNDSAGAARMSTSPRYRRRSEKIKRKARRQQQDERSAKVENIAGFLEKDGLHPSRRAYSSSTPQQKRIKPKQRKHSRHHQQHDHGGSSNRAVEARSRLDPISSTTLSKNSMKHRRRSKFQREHKVMNQQHPQAMQPRVSTKYHDHPQQQQHYQYQPQPQYQQQQSQHQSQHQNQHQNQHRHPYQHHYQQQQRTDAWGMAPMSTMNTSNATERRDDSFLEFFDAVPYHDVQSTHNNNRSMRGTRNTLYQTQMMEEREDPRIMSLDYALD